VTVLDDLEVLEPTQSQITNCEASGWRYLGDGIFGRGDIMGVFTREGFKKL
jgi:hypothetical protein